jgi:glutaredoxin-related protein
MNATKKLAAALLLFTATSIFTIGALLKEKNTIPANSQNPDFILYYGNSCPHCKIVEEYIKKNDLSSKLKIAQKEVSQNQGNQKEFIEIAKTCKLDVNNLVVPTILDAKNSQCYIGDQPIINFLNQQANPTK